MIRNGTISSNAEDGVLFSSTPPVMPPAAQVTLARTIRGPWPRSSCRAPAAVPAGAASSATVLVMLAATGGIPAASSTG